MGTERDEGRLAGDWWDRDTSAKGDEDLALLGTVTEQAEVVRLRDQLEKAAFASAVELRRDQRVLDLGGGAGRIALFLAPRVAEVVVVDSSEGLLERGRRAAARMGVDNVRFVHGSVTAPPVEGRYDLVIAFGVGAHLDDGELEGFAADCARLVEPGGRVVLKEPVTTDGELRFDRRYEGDALLYEVRFRPREAYADAFGRHLELVHQRPTCAHLVPWFLGSTQGAAEATESGAGGRLLNAVGPWMTRHDADLQALERRLRGHPLGRRLLAPVPVLQDLYVLRPRPPVSDAPDLSVVTIAYNESDCLEPVAAELCAALRDANIDFEVVLVDDGSSDDTFAIMGRMAERDPVFRPLTQENRGIGGALRTGFDAARGRFVTWVPADGQIGPDTVVELYRRRDEAPMLTTVYTRRDDPWYRTVISRSLNTMIKLRTGQVAKSGGNYLFEREMWTRHGPRGDDSMMISTAFRHNLREAGVSIVEVGIAARARVAGHSKVLNPRAILRTLRSLGGM